jgi:predicted RNase H-like nuclease (RuvC/YqgF family)
MKVFQYLKRYPKITAVILALLVLITLWLVIATKTREGKPVGIPQEAVEAHDEAQRQKGAADELRRQQEGLKKEIEELARKNVELEQEVQSAKAETEATRRAYQNSRSVKPRHTVVDSNTSTNSLCTRAAKSGIKCD